MASQEENAAAQNLSAAHYAHRNDPDQDADQTDPGEDDDAAAAGGTNIMRLYSNLNSKITDLFDGLGIRRSLTIAHQVGQSMGDHIDDVSKAAQTVGGLTGNFITATHTRHDPKGGATVLHSTDKLQTTVIPKNSELAKNAIQACKTLVNKIGLLLPEKELHRDDAPQMLVDRAKAQIALISKHGGEGMSAFDLGGALIAIPHPLLQMLARLHSTVKHGEHHAALTAPQEQPEQSEQEQPAQQ